MALRRIVDVLLAGRRRGRVVGRHFRKRRLPRVNRIAAADQDVGDRSVRQGDLDGRAVTANTLVGGRTVRLAVYTGVPCVLGGLRLLERHALGTDGALGAVPEFLSRLIEAGLVLGQQRGPVVRIRVESERVRPDGQLPGTVASLGDEEVALSIRQIGDVRHGCLVLRAVLVIHLVALVRERDLGELCQAGARCVGCRCSTVLAGALALLEGGQFRLCGRLVGRCGRSPQVALVGLDGIVGGLHLRFGGGNLRGDIRTGHVTGVGEVRGGAPRERNGQKRREGDSDRLE